MIWISQTQQSFVTMTLSLNLNTRGVESSLVLVAKEFSLLSFSFFLFFSLYLSWSEYEEKTESLILKGGIYRLLVGLSDLSSS